jgi:hypothetical protein
MVGSKHPEGVLRMHSRLSHVMEQGLMLLQVPDEVVSKEFQRLPI